MIKSALRLSIFWILFLAAACQNINLGQLEALLVNHDQRQNIAQIISLNASLPVQGPASQNTRIDLQILLQDGTETKRSVISKLLIPDSSESQIIPNSQLFNQEITAYRQGFSRINKILKSMDDDSEPLWVQALGIRPFSQLILEDLQGIGYSNGNISGGLDRDETLLALRGLAKLHAASVIANEENDYSLEQQFNQSLIQQNYDQLEYYYTSLYDNLAQLIEQSWGPEWQSVAERVRNIAPTVKDELQKIDSDKSKILNVLNVGSPNIRNIWFKRSITNLVCSEQPIAVRFSYFQLIFFGSPLIDVQYLINTCPRLDVLRKYRRELLWSYYDSLLEYLEKLGYDGELPTENEFNNEVHRTILSGLTSALQVLPLRFGGSVQQGSDTSEQGGTTSAPATNENTSGVYSQQYQQYMKVILNQALLDRLL